MSGAIGVRGSLAVALACLLGCGGPRDPGRTSEGVLVRGLRAGVVLDPPWACQVGERRELRGADVELVRALARACGVDVTVTVGGEARLLAALGRLELDLVVGGLVMSDEHREEVGLTRPHYLDGDGEHVFAVPPGENAWAVQVEAFLAGADVAGARLRGVAECGEP